MCPIKSSPIRKALSYERTDLIKETSASELSPVDGFRKNPRDDISALLFLTATDSERCISYAYIYAERGERAEKMHGVHHSSRE